ncbi:MAG: hypothetical protein MJE77_08570 [Proteobacteria bacterium]|nr:hypothetical protein [Pseudomonadota bacterium]
MAAGRLREFERAFHQRAAPAQCVAQDSERDSEQTRERSRILHEIHRRAAAATRAVLAALAKETAQEHQPQPEMER